MSLEHIFDGLNGLESSGKMTDKSSHMAFDMVLQMQSVIEQVYCASRVKDLQSNQIIVLYTNDRQPYQATVKSVSPYYPDFCIVRVYGDGQRQDQSISFHPDQLIEVLP